MEKILEYKEINGITYYRVRWKNTSVDMDSWLTHNDFLDYGTVTRYKKEIGKQVKSGSPIDESKPRNLKQSIVTPPVTKSMPKPRGQILLSELVNLVMYP